MQQQLLTQATAVIVTELEMKLSPLFMLTCRVADLWRDNQSHFLLFKAQNQKNWQAVNSRC